MKGFIKGVLILLCMGNLVSVVGLSNKESSRVESFSEWKAKVEHRRALVRVRQEMEYRAKYLANK